VLKLTPEVPVLIKSVRDAREGGEREMRESKMDCWEFKKCGREPNGAREREFGTCPASVEARLHGVHGGTNAGRSCWVLAGTLCGGQVQGTFAQKYKSCKTCDFYAAVREEEFPHFLLSALLLRRLSQ
jgi:hypothetical protein